VSEYLPNDILAKADRMSMAHGLEVRAPFLNPAVADYALRLPAWLKVGARGPTKRVLRALAHARYGSSIALAGKQGFSVPVHAWLRGPARPLVTDLLSAESIRRIPALDPAGVQRALDAHMSGRRSLGFELWGLMVLVAWHRRHIEARPEPGDVSGPSERLLAPEHVAV
jgi:asparagine synthase (glutamine-hydrolysing)